MFASLRVARYTSVRRPLSDMPIPVQLSATAIEVSHGHGYQLQSWVSDAAMDISCSYENQL